MAASDIASATLEPLDLQLAHKGAFISGQNGIGKSTLLRPVGLNLLAARVGCLTG